MGKLLVLGVGLVVLVGGGVGAGLYAASAGLVGGGHGQADEKPKPKLVMKSEQKRGGEGDTKGGDAAESSHEGKPVPEVAGG